MDYRTKDFDLYRRHGMDMMGVMVGKPHIKWGADEAGVAAIAQT